MAAIGHFDLSTAVFAPGWVFENQDLLREEFVENENKYVSYYVHLLVPWVIVILILFIINLILL